MWISPRWKLLEIPGSALHGARAELAEKSKLCEEMKSRLSSDVQRKRQSEVALNRWFKIAATLKMRRMTRQHRSKVSARKYALKRMKKALSQFGAERMSLTRRAIEKERLLMQERSMLQRARQENSSLKLQVLEVLGTNGGGGGMYRNGNSSPGSLESELQALRKELEEVRKVHKRDMDKVIEAHQKELEAVKVELAKARRRSVQWGDTHLDQSSDRHSVLPSGWPFTEVAVEGNSQGGASGKFRSGGR